MDKVIVTPNSANYLTLDENMKETFYVNKPNEEYESVSKIESTDHADDLITMSNGFVVLGFNIEPNSNYSLQYSDDELSLNKIEG